MGLIIMKNMNKIKYIVSTVFIFAVFMAPTSVALADSYINLNSHPLDFETLRVGNVTQNPNTTSADWGTSVYANPGDVLSLAIYYHNATDKTAQHLRVHLVPKNSLAEAKIHVFKAEIWSNQHKLVSGNITIKLSEPRRIDYIKDSVVWRPNQTIYSSQNLLFGQNPDNIFTNGIILGDIYPGWSTQGNVVVGFKVAQNGNSVAPTNTTSNNSVKTVYVPVNNNIGSPFFIEKEVENVDNPNGTDLEVAAKRGDLVKFKITVRNISDRELYNIEVIDEISNFLRFVNSEEENSDFTQKKIIWNIDKLSPKEKRELVLETIVADDAEFEGVIKNGGERTTAELNGKIQTSNEVFVRVSKSVNIFGPIGGLAAGLWNFGSNVLYYLGILAFIILAIWGTLKFAKK